MAKKYKDSPQALRERIRKNEAIIYEREVREYKINIKKEQMAHLVCYHPSTEQMVNYRMHTTPDGIVTKVEVEKKVKGKSVWMCVERAE